MLDSDREELLSAYLDGELAGDELSRAEQLLATEPEARDLLRDMERLRDAIRGLPRERLPDDFARRVVARADRALTLRDDLMAPGPQEPFAAAAHVVRADGRRWLARDSRLWRPLFYASATIAAAILVAIFGEQKNDDLAMAPTRLPAARPGSDRVMMKQAGPEAATGFQKDHQLTGTAENGANGAKQGRYTASGSYSVQLRAGRQNKTTAGEPGARSPAEKGDENLAPKAMYQSYPWVQDADRNELLVVEGAAASAASAGQYLDRLLVQNNIRVEQQATQQVPAQSSGAARDQALAAKRRGPVEQDVKQQNARLLRQVNCLVTASRQQIDAVVEQLNTSASPVKGIAVRTDSPESLNWYFGEPEQKAPTESDRLLPHSKADLAKEQSERARGAAESAKGPQDAPGTKQAAPPLTSKFAGSTMPAGVHAGSSQTIAKPPGGTIPPAAVAPPADSSQEALLQVPEGQVRALFILREEPLVDAAPTATAPVAAEPQR